MPDLRVNTDELRGAALGLRRAGQVAVEVANDGGQLRSYIPCVGGRRPAEALGGFLGEWNYGMGLIGHDVDTLAAYLSCCADAYEAAEYQLAVAAGGASAARPPTATPEAMPELPGPRRLEYWTQTTGLGVPVTLATAAHWRQLVPGEPTELATLATRLRGFAGSASDAAAELARLSGTGWTGQAAEVFAGHVGSAPGRLRAAAGAFDDAADALTRYLPALEDAQHRAAASFNAWQDAHARAEAGTPPGSGTASFEQEMSAAANKLALAQDDVAAAGRALASVLDEAGDRAPNEPGLLSRITSAVVSFATGVGEGTVGMVTGAAALVELAVKLSPTYALINPQDYLDTVAGVVNGVQLAIEHPGATAKALVDWDTWSEDPARALGRLVPELLLTLATAGAGGAAKAGSATRRLDHAADLIRAKGDELFPHLDEAAVRAKVVDRGYDPDTPSGRAVAFQVGEPYGGTDVWTDATLTAGDRIAVGRGGRPSGFAVPLQGDPATGVASEWFEGVQVAPRRLEAVDAPVPQPTVRAGLEVYEVRGDANAAQSITGANPQFGGGGTEQLFVPDFKALVNDGVLVKVGEHDFRPNTIESLVEDPRYRAVDPGLPEHALDPAHERVSGRVEGAAIGAGAAVATPEQQPTGGTS